MLHGLRLQRTIFLSTIFYFIVNISTERYALETRILCVWYV